MPTIIGIDNYRKENNINTYIVQWKSTVTMQCKLLDWDMAQLWNSMALETAQLWYS